MATKLYPSVITLDSETHRGTNSNNAAGTPIGWTVRGLAPSGSTSMQALATSTVAGPTAGVEISSASTAYEFISFPIAADVTISGTISFNIWAGESATAANTGLQVIIERLDSQLNIVSTVTNSEKGTELPKYSSVAAQVWNAASVTSTNFLRGDRIRVRILGNDAGGTMAAGQTFTVDINNGGNPGVDGDSWIQFNETLTFETADPSGSVLFFTSTSAGIDPGAATELEAWTSRGSGVTTAVTNTAAGWTAPIPITATAGGTQVEWYSKPLTAFTLGGKSSFSLRMAESNGSANASWWAEIAVCNGDGSSPVIWGAGGRNPYDSGDNGEVGITESAKLGAISGPNTSVAGGQRLRFRIYLDDMPATPIASGFTVTFYYNGTSGGASGDSFVTLPQTVTEYVPPVDMPDRLPRYGQALMRASGR